MAHHERSHVLEKTDIFIIDAVSRGIVKDAVSSNASSTWCRYGYAGVEACSRSISHVWAVAESSVFQKIFDDMNFTGILFVPVGPLISFRDVDGVFTHRKTSVQNNQSDIVSMLGWRMYLLTEE